MRILKILLIGLLFINCSKPVEITTKTISVKAPEPVYTYEISKELKPYVFEYLNVLEDFNIDFNKQSFIVVFDADIIETDLAGQAKGMHNNNLVYVKVNPKMFNELTHKQKRHLIFHELSHDLFNTRHAENIVLMRPSLPSPSESFTMDIEKEIVDLMMHIRNGQR